MESAETSSLYTPKCSPRTQKRVISFRKLSDSIWTQLADQGAPQGKKSLNKIFLLGPFLGSKTGRKIEIVFKTLLLTPWSPPDRVKTPLGRQKALQNGTQHPFKRRTSKSQILPLFTTLGRHYRGPENELFRKHCPNRSSDGCLCACRLH